MQALHNYFTQPVWDFVQVTSPNNLNIRTKCRCLCNATFLVLIMLAKILTIEIHSFGAKCSPGPK